MVQCPALQTEIRILYYIIRNTAVWIRKASDEFRRQDTVAITILEPTAKIEKGSEEHSLLWVRTTRQVYGLRLVEYKPFASLRIS